jgi:glycine/D-amino acid oxidase-like deaminating enzyme
MRDLRGGTTLWETHNARAGTARPLEGNTKCDILIIGAGITGAFLAERLSRDSTSIIVVDRNNPQTASTAASTALLQWEIDTPLNELANLIGFEPAAEVYRASIEGVAGIVRLVHDLAIDCQCVPRPSLYLAGTEMGPAELLHEQHIREQAGIASCYLDGKQLESRFGFRRPAALFDQGCAEVDPVALARGLMDYAVTRGVHIHSPVDVIEYDLSARGASVLTADGFEVGARTLILANGYDMPSFVPASVHKVVSTWVVATAPETTAPWPGHALVWEASNPYLYARHTAEARLIIGGEDEATTDADERDRKIPEKAARLLQKFSAIRAGLSLEADYAWSGFFGTTEDGLPLIGNVPGAGNTYSAFGYGGNGITFSAIAAGLIGHAMTGRSHRLLGYFAIDR